jgi:uncharacterized protein YcgL (UPF0745 family)
MRIGLSQNAIREKMQISAVTPPMNKQFCAVYEFMKKNFTWLRNYINKKDHAAKYTK